MTPIEVFGRFAKFIEVDAEGCWNWTGQLRGRNKKVPYITESGSHKNALRYGLAQAGLPFKGDQVMVCENDLCVNPEDAADTYSVVGRMMKIRHDSRQDGDCRIWEGSLSDGHPRVSAKFGESERMSHIHVRKLVWIAEHVPEGWDWPTTGEYDEVTCGNDLCVSHKHIKRKVPEGDYYDLA